MQHSLPLSSTEKETGDDPFTAFARVLAASEQAEGKPAASPKRAEGVVLEKADHQARDCAANKFEYEIESEPPLAAPPALAATAEPSESGKDSDAMSKRLEALRAENERLRRRLVQWQAEFDNVRRRYEREQEMARHNIQGELLKEFLPLLDNFERGLGHTMTEPVGEEFITGMILIYKQFCALLERCGVAPIEALGEIFNPNLHEAVIIEPRPGYEAHTVIAELEKGYTIGNRLLRPARVKVATRP